MTRLFDNPTKAVYVIVAFVVLLLLLFSITSRGSELSVEGGSAVGRGETPTIGLDIRWPTAGPARTDYELGFNLIGESVYKDKPVSNQIAWHGMLWDGYKNFEMGIGAAYFNVPSPYTCDLNFALGARYRLGRVAVTWRHFSSAGSCHPNIGRDLLTAAWSF